MIHATIKMRMPSHKVGEAVEILLLAAERTRVQPGCISCRIYQDAKDERVIMFDEMWRTQEDLDSHLRSDEYRNVLLVVEMADEKPEIIFNPLSDSTGMETIEKARGTRF
jgi:quinol monooxygenase YgiN